jgi:hypothetical protein
VFRLLSGFTALAILAHAFRAAAPAKTVKLVVGQITQAGDPLAQAQVLRIGCIGASISPGEFGQGQWVPVFEDEAPRAMARSNGNDAPRLSAMVTAVTGCRNRRKCASNLAFGG